MNKLWLKVLLSLALTGGLVSISLIPVFSHEKDNKNDEISTINLENVIDHKWTFNESSNSNGFGFRSINSVVKKIIKDSNKDVDLNEITVTSYLGNLNEIVTKPTEQLIAILPTDVPIFINDFSILIESEKYNTKEVIYVNNNFSFFDLEIAKDFYVNFNNTRPLDSKLWVNELFGSLNSFLSSHDNLKKLSNELFEKGFLSEKINFITNPFLYSSGDFEFDISNLEFTAGYSELTFKETDPNYKSLVNYGILKNKGETKLLSKFNVTFFDKKNEYHEKVVGLKGGIFDKGIKQEDRIKNNDFLKFSYNDDTTIEEINTFLPTLLVRSEAYNHSSWFVNPSKFKFSYWTTASDSGRQYLNEEKISDLWGFTSGKPYFAVKIDDVTDDNVDYEDISFNVFFKTGGLVWDGSEYNGN